MDLPTKPECSWECEGCILCDPPIPILNNENNKDNEDNENNEEESWENDEFIDKLTTEMKIKEEKIRTKEEDKLYLKKQAQKKEFLKFHKDIRRFVYYAKTSFYETYFMSRHCSKLYDVWTDGSFICLLNSQCWKYFIDNVYYENNNYKEYLYKEYLFCNKEDCCCKKILEVIKSNFIGNKINIKNLRATFRHNIDKLEKLEYLENLEKLEKLEYLEKLEKLENLEKLEKLENLEKLDKKIN